MEYKVSRQTAELIKAYDLLGEVSRHLYNGLSGLYSDTQTEKMIDEGITAPIIKLQVLVMNWVETSIMNNRGLLNRVERVRSHYRSY